MILTDNDILNYIRVGEIEITPFKKENLGSNSYDLTLGDKIMVYTAKVLDPKEDNPTYIVPIPEEGMVLEPGELYLGYTNEFTRSRKVVPQLEGKSSIARLGISVHLTAGFGDIGFAGHWTLEITVVRPVIVYPNMPIAQIYFMMAMGKCNQPYSSKDSAKYKGQHAEPVSSRMWMNFK